MSSNRMTSPGLGPIPSLLLSGSVLVLGVGSMMIACSVSTTPILTFPDSGFGDDGGFPPTPDAPADNGNTPDVAPTPDAPAPMEAAPCDIMGANCVACGNTHCAAPNECCGASGSLSCKPSSACGDASLSYACDGPQSCTGGNVCCVNLSSSQGSTSGATATCQGSSVCMVQSGSTGTSAIITSVACNSSGDCGNVVDGFGVPQNNCCKSPGYSVGVCLSDTYAGVVMGYGGTCN